MKAWIGAREGKAPSYRLEELPAPVPGARQVLLRVRAVGLNLVDRFPKAQHFSHTPPSPAAIPGMEVAGEIAEGAPGDSSSASSCSSSRGFTRAGGSVRVSACRRMAMPRGVLS